MLLVSLMVRLSWVEVVLGVEIGVKCLDANNFSLRISLFEFDFKLPDVVGIMVVIANERNYKS